MNKVQELNQHLSELTTLELALMIKKCPKDPWLWLTGTPLGKRWTPGASEGLVWTKDEHDVEHPFKLFPNREYLWITTMEWLNNLKIVVPKSRQILITWLMVSLHLWMFQFQKGRLIFFQNKKEEDADAMLDRARFIYDHEPPELQAKCPVKKVGNKWSYCKIIAQENGELNAYSKIKAIPQGPDIVRLHTASAIFSDENAFQDRAEETYSACKPTIDGGGKLTVVSTANGKNFFYNLFKGDIK